jgi:hypothetical protein
MEIVAHGVLVGEAFQERDIAIVHIVETHRIAATVVIHLVGNRKAEGVDFTGVCGDDERIEIVEAARGIVTRGVADAAIRLLPHLKETVRAVARVGIVGQTCSCERERAVRQAIEIVDAGIGIRDFCGLRDPGGARGQEVQIGCLQ